ncbi:MAG: thiolase family protein [Desulfomonilia bacterium]|jgi:acetyl-CoA acyltransferase
MRDVFIIGVDTLRFKKYLNQSIKELTRQTVMGCLKDAGLEKKDIQAACFSNSGWGELGQSCIRGEVALRPIGIDTIPITNVENACAGGSTALHHAWMSVASGLYDIAMAVGAEKLYRKNTRENFAQFLTGVDFEDLINTIQKLDGFAMTEEDRENIRRFREKYPVDAPRSSKSKNRSFSKAIKELKDTATVFIRLGEIMGYANVLKIASLAAGDHSPFMDIYGYSARQHMKKFGSTVEQLAVIASKNHFNSTLNPNAQYRFEVPVEKVLKDRLVSWPITRSMCAPVGDGAASAIVCSKSVVKKLGLSRQAVRIRASILGTGKDRPYGFDEPEIGERLSRLAYEKSGLGPEDISMAEVHDATAYGELRQAENLGFCPAGEGGILAESGATSLSGRIPINTSGGLISRGHPVGASGLAQIHEIVTQLRGRAGKRQIAAPRIGMAENGGGALGVEEAAMCIHILEAPSRH